MKFKYYFSNVVCCKKWQQREVEESPKGHHQEEGTPKDEMLWQRLSQ
jgi:hypothetical protein